MGRRLDPHVRLADSIEYLVPSKSKAVATVLASRADVAAAREAVTAAQAEIKLQKALGVPDVDLLAGYKRNSGANTLYSGLQMQLPFRNRNQGEVQRAEANLRLAQDQLQQIEISVGADVTAAQESYARQKEIVEDILPEMLPRAQQHRPTRRARYTTGG